MRIWVSRDKNEKYPILIQDCNNGSNSWRHFDAHFRGASHYWRGGDGESLCETADSWIESIGISIWKKVCDKANVPYYWNNLDENWLKENLPYIDERGKLTLPEDRVKDEHHAKKMAELAKKISDKEEVNNSMSYYFNNAVEAVRPFGAGTSNSDARQIFVKTNKIRKVISALKKLGYVISVTQTQTDGRLYTKVICVDGVVVFINAKAEEKEIEKDKDMNVEKDKDMTFKQRFIRNAEKMAYRQGARKSLNIAHAFILYAAHTHLNFDESKLGVLLEILETDFGKALLCYGAGEALQKFQGDNDILRNLAEEFQVSGMDLGAEAGFEKLLSMRGEIMPVIGALTQAIKTMGNDKSIIDVMMAWKAVDDAIPQKVRVAAENAVRVAAEPIRIQTEPDKDLQVELELDVEAVTESPKYANCS